MGHLRKVRNAAISAIAILEDGTPVYPFFAAEGDDTGEAGAGEGGDGTADKDEADSDKSEKDDDEEDADPKARRIRKLKDENAERRVAAKALEKERDELAEKLRQADLKDKTELEKIQSDFKILQEKFDKREEQFKGNLLELEALRLSPKLKLKWKDSDDVLSALARNKDLSVSDDGEVSGVEEALKALAKAKPHWLESEEDSSKNGKGAKGAGTNGASGGSFSGKQNKDGDATRAALETKYPSLRGR